MLEEISKKCNLSQSKVIDLAIEELYKKIKTEGLTIKMEQKKIYSIFLSIFTTTILVVVNIKKESN